MSDSWHDECGVFGIHGHPEASNMAYLGLYALQHRGQESAGIASTDGERIIFHKEMGLVADIFSEEILSRLPGPEMHDSARAQANPPSARSCAEATRSAEAASRRNSWSRFSWARSTGGGVPATMP